MTPPSADGAPDDESGDDEWRFSLEDLADDTGNGADTEEGADTEDGGSVFGPRPDEGTVDVDPGDPDLENALFVLLGVATTVVLMLDLVGAI